MISLFINIFVLIFLKFLLYLLMNLLWHIHFLYVHFRPFAPNTFKVGILNLLNQWASHTGDAQHTSYFLFILSKVSIIILKISSSLLIIEESACLIHLTVTLCFFVRRNYGTTH